MRVLVTGATGFIGRYCVPVLAAHGWDVHAVCHRSAPTEANGVQWHRADLLDGPQARELVSEVRATHLLHLAWDIVPGKWPAAQEHFAWVQASLALVAHFRACGGRRVVMAGSCMEYDWRYGYCSETTTPLDSTTFYGQCKHGLHALVSAYAARERLGAAWARVFFLYGPHEAPARLVASVARALLRGEPALCSHGNQIRDYLHVEDAAAAFVALVEGGVEGPINIASGQPVAVKDIVYKIARYLGRVELVRLGAVATSPDEAPLVIGNPARLRQEVGWQPCYDFDSGLEHTIEWWRRRIEQDAFALEG